MYFKTNQHHLNKQTIFFWKIFQFNSILIYIVITFRDRVASESDFVIHRNHVSFPFRDNHKHKFVVPGLGVLNKFHCLIMYLYIFISMIKAHITRKYFAYFKNT